MSPTADRKKNYLKQTPMERVINLVDSACNMNSLLPITALGLLFGLTTTAYISSPLPEFCKVTSSMPIVSILFVFVLGTVTFIIGSLMPTNRISHNESTKVNSSLMIERIIAYTVYTTSRMALIFTFVLFPVVAQLEFGKFSCWGIMRKILVIGGCIIVGLALLYYACKPFVGQFDPHKEDQEKDGNDKFAIPGYSEKKVDQSQHPPVEQHLTGQQLQAYHQQLGQQLAQLQQACQQLQAYQQLVHQQQAQQLMIGHLQALLQLFQDAGHVIVQDLPMTQRLG